MVNRSRKTIRYNGVHAWIRMTGNVFGKGLKVSRCSRGKTVQEACDIFGILKSAWGSWESGRSLPQERFLYPILEEWPDLKYAAIGGIPA